MSQLDVSGVTLRRRFNASLDLGIIGDGHLNCQNKMSISKSLKFRTIIL